VNCPNAKEKTVKVGVFGSSNKIKNVETIREIVQWLQDARYEAVEFCSQK
jgi:hypothetical protein